MEVDTTNGEHYILSDSHDESNESRNNLPEISGWLQSSLELSDELPDNDDDWKALKAALLDTLPSQPIDLFCELGLNSEVLLHETRQPTSHPSSSSGSLGGSNQQPSSYTDSSANGDVEDHAFSNSYNANGAVASISGWRSTSMDSDEEGDGENEEELLKISKEQGKTRLQFRGKEYILLNNVKDAAEQYDYEETALSGEEIDSLENIFKVWDLETPDVEDELTKQLRKALGKNFPDALAETDTPLASLDSKDIDELVSGIADLSLQSPLPDQLLEISSDMTGLV